MAFALEVSGGNRARNWLMMAVLAVPGPPTSSDDCCSKAATLAAGHVGVSSGIQHLW